MSENKVIVIAGPTASGKSALAIDVALVVNGVVVNADSMQVYKDMPVISAVPSAEDREKADHRLYEIYDPSYRGNVVDWLKKAVFEIENIQKEGKTPVVVGGTGLYLENLIKGTTPIPETPEKIRKNVERLFEKKGKEFVFQKLQEVDKETAEKLSQNDTSRIKRAYEVYLHTDIPISEWHRKPLIKYLPQTKFFIIKICPSTEELDKLSYQRFDKMLKEGALDEVQRLYERGLDLNLPAMKALGVPELVGYLTGHLSLRLASQNAKLHTRQYAKRQRTWFKNRLKADFEIKECYKGHMSEELSDMLKQFSMNDI